MQDIKGTKVFVYKGGKASSNIIELGIRKESTIQVTRGLTPGDTLITSGILQIKQGSAVKIVSSN